MGNIPAGDMPALISLAEEALNDTVYHGGKLSGSLLPLEFKPILKDVDDKGNPATYGIQIEYIGSDFKPVKITIKNARCPFYRNDAGLLICDSSKTYNLKTIVFRVGITEWYNQLYNANRFYELSLQRKAQMGYFDEAFGMKF